MLYDITLSQLLNDGDTALVEEHKNITGYYVQDIIAEYHKRAVSRSYVVNYTVVVIPHY